jgi:hypothetical protein
MTPGEEPHVVPCDLYERLFSMLSPSESNAKRYWHPKAVTRRNGDKDKRNRVSDNGVVSSKSKTTRRVNGQH